MSERTGAAVDAWQNERVARRIEQFKRKCGEHGEEVLNFAYHAALPVALNPEFLHLLRINFFVDIERPLPYEVEYEFLLSSLCRQIDEGLYEVERDVRLVLLEGLSREFGQERMREVAMLLWKYVEQQEPWRQSVSLRQAQKLTILSHLDSQKAKDWIELARSKKIVALSHDREWLIAMHSEVVNINELQHAFEVVSELRKKMLVQLEKCRTVHVLNEGLVNSGKLQEKKLCEIDEQLKELLDRYKKILEESYLGTIEKRLEMKQASDLLLVLEEELKKLLSQTHHHINICVNNATLTEFLLDFSKENALKNIDDIESVQQRVSAVVVPLQENINKLIGPNIQRERNIEILFERVKDLIQVYSEG